MKLRNVTQIKTENIVTKIDPILDSIHEIYMEKHQHWYPPFENAGTRILTVGEIPWDRIKVLPSGNSSRYKDIDWEVVQNLMDDIVDGKWKPYWNAPPLVVQVMIDDELCFVLVNGHHRYLAWQLALKKGLIDKSDIKFHAAVGYFVDTNARTWVQNWIRYQYDSNPKKRKQNIVTVEDDALNIATELKTKYKPKERVNTNTKLTAEINQINKTNGYEGKALIDQNRLVKKLMKVDSGNLQSYTDVDIKNLLHDSGIDEPLHKSILKGTIDGISKNNPFTPVTWDIFVKTINYIEKNKKLPEWILTFSNNVPHERIDGGRKKVNKCVMSWQINEVVRILKIIQEHNVDLSEMKIHYGGQKSNETKGELYNV